MTSVPVFTSAPNRLLNERSPYLRAAAHQPVGWYAWGREAFADAERLQRPMLLDIGAAWCHWCHVMDEESYENADVAAVLNASFVAVKVDRDERPDVDARYQRAVQAMTGQGGWPLTVFLRPDGSPFYGGTYFPAEARYGRPAFADVLRSVARAWRENRAQVDQQSEALLTVLRHEEAPPGDLVLAPATIARAIDGLLSTTDPEHGGFGDAPKFFHVSALAWLLETYADTPGDRLRGVLDATLGAMAHGGVFDQAGGGFHRYAVDARWVVPHFEKMLIDNAELLRLYSWASSVLDDARWRGVAEGIMRWLEEMRVDRDRAGYGASQDADAAPGDDGSYFTWTVAEARAAVGEDDFPVVQLYYNIFDDGEMASDRARNVLFVDVAQDAIAARLGMTRAAVDDALERAREALLRARGQRRAPAVDPTLYVGANALVATALFAAWRTLGSAHAHVTALALVERLLDEGIAADGRVRHAVHDASCTGLLEDHAYLLEAVLAAFEVTGESVYLDHALRLADTALALLYDAERHAFRDRPVGGEEAGMLGVALHPIHDSPATAPAAVVCGALRTLQWLTGKTGYGDCARDVVRAALPQALEQPLFAAGILRAAAEEVRPPAHVVIVGDTRFEQTARLVEAATRAARPDWHLVRLEAPLHPATGAAIRAMAAADGAAAYVCRGTACSAPCRTEDELAHTLAAAPADPPA